MGSRHGKPKKRKTSRYQKSANFFPGPSKFKCWIFHWLEGTAPLQIEEVSVILAIYSSIHSGVICRESPATPQGLVWIRYYANLTMSYRPWCTWNGCFGIRIPDKTGRHTRYIQIYPICKQEIHAPGLQDSGSLMKVAQQNGSFLLTCPLVQHFPPKKTMNFIIFHQSKASQMEWFPFKSASWLKIWVHKWIQMDDTVNSSEILPPVTRLVVLFYLTGIFCGFQMV